MTYLDRLAAKIEQEVPGDLLPDMNTRPLFRLYAVLALAKGTTVEVADVHNAWAAWMQERQPSHRSLVPFDDLDPETRAADEPFAQAIRTMAQHLAENAY